MYYRFKKQKNNIDFINWLYERKELTIDDIQEITNTINIYKNVSNELTNYKYVPIRFGIMDRKEIHDILEKERFVF